ncbi:MAG TPA: hypothetical protein VFC78_23550 [Tepidisphaeraceae bacterium]|nr:hypothetical protein [Tepidisphaeraceae bacterium]
MADKYYWNVFGEPAPATHPAAIDINGFSGEQFKASDSREDSIFELLHTHALPLGSFAI